MANVDHAKLEEAVKMLLEAVGEDPTREGLLDTPARVARMYEEIFLDLIRIQRNISILFLGRTMKNSYL